MWPPQASLRHRSGRLGVAVVALVAAFLVASCGGDAPVARTGDPAPPFAATALDGATVDLAAYRGRPVVVNFWASWCGPCRDEFPLLAERLAELGPRDGLAIIGVLYKDDAASAQRFLDEFGKSWPTVPDPDGSIAAAYRVVAPPQTYFIDAGGVLRGIQIGEVRAEDFATQYAKIAP